MPRVFESGFGPDGVYTPNPYFMERAFDLARISREFGNKPLGAVIAGHNRNYDPLGLSEMVLGEGMNEFSSKNRLQHAVTTALHQAVDKVGRKGLSEAVLYISHEGCVMCSGAVANSKLAGVIYSTSFDDKNFSDNIIRIDQILAGREEKGVPSQFIKSGFLYEQGLVVLNEQAVLV